VSDEIDKKFFERWNKMKAWTDAGKDLFDMNAETRMNDRIGDFTVDTNDTCDAGWETGIVNEKDGGISVVENYETQGEAAIGHQKWMEKVKKGLTAEDLAGGDA